MCSLEKVKEKWELGSVRIGCIELLDRVEYWIVHVETISTCQDP